MKKFRDDNMNDRQKRIDEAMQKYFGSRKEVMKEGKHARQRQFVRRKYNWKRCSSDFIECREACKNAGKNK